MCGLSGLIDTKPNHDIEIGVRIKRMTDTLVSRGPDAQGIWIKDNIALGHRRLSILDLSPAGAQPMLSDDGRYVVVYNGEIYNHLALRADLGQGGFPISWRGHSDTETLLACLQAWGMDETLRRSVGMFAIAVWDTFSGVLSLARDRMGEKPLYWGWAGQTFVFGSELKALRAHPDFPTAICREATLQYLRFRYVPAPRSIHPGVFKLEPGCILQIDGAAPAGPPARPLRPGERHGTLSIRRYWSLDETVKTSSEARFTDDVHALESLEKALQTAVARQMLSDVPVGAFLSGGVDSSLIVALMQRQSTYPVRTFTVGFEDKAFDESPFAAAVAHHLGTDHTELMVTDLDARNVISDLPVIYDEPFADPSQIPTYLICKAARHHVTVALSGDGGDELFGGYNRHFWAPRLWKTINRIPARLRFPISAGIQSVPIPYFDGMGSVYNRFRAGSQGVADLGIKAHRLASAMNGVQNIKDLYRNIVSDWVHPESLVLGATEPPSTIEDPVAADLIGGSAGIMMFQDMRSYLPDDVLCKVDRAAMAVSLETRVPFLDRDVVEISARLPIHLKIQGTRGKVALRTLLSDLVPQQLIERPKAGFAVPIADWLRGPLREWAEDLLDPDFLSKDGLLNPAPIRRAWADHLSGRRDRSSNLWTVLMLQCWRRQWS